MPALSDVTVGTCVTVLEPAASGTATGSATSGPATQVTAASVEVRPATNGECAGGFGGAGGPGGTAGAPGAGGTPPAGAPTGAPTGTATNGTGGRGGADFGRRAVAGLVTAVSGDTITVQETMRARGDGTASSTATASPTTATVTVTTTVVDDLHRTEGRRRQRTSAVGSCASALGKADDTGAVTATSITLRPATNGSCTTGFGGAGGRGARDRHGDDDRGSQWLIRAAAPRDGAVVGDGAAPWRRAPWSCSAPAATSPTPR